MNIRHTLLEYSQFSLETHGHNVGPHCPVLSSSSASSPLITSLQMGGFVCHGGKQPVPGWLLPPSPLPSMSSQSFEDEVVEPQTP